VPIKQINFAQNKSKNEARIFPGRVVTYEQHAKINLGLVLAEKSGKWRVLNPQGAELMLPASRLAILPDVAPDSLSNTTQKTDYLQTVTEAARAELEEIRLEEVWTLIQEKAKETSVKEITDILCNEDTNATQFAVRLALSEDEVYFKRKKVGFEPRTPEVVEELKIKVKIEEEKRERRDRLYNECLARLSDETAPLPGDIELLEKASLFGNSANESKEIRELIDRIVEKVDLGAGRRLEDKAFRLLAGMGHYSIDENLLPRKLGRPIEFSTEELEDTARLIEHASAQQDDNREDFREIFTVTIDGAETRDFDDALSAERTSKGYRVGIHISDVASVLTEDSIVASAGMRRGTSIYCPDEQFPMLPTELSEGALSLRENEERLALSLLVELDEGYSIVERRICASRIKVDKRLTYDEADTILYGELEVSEQLSESLSFLWDVAGNSEVRRVHNGALQLNRREQTPVVSDGGKVSLVDANEDKPSRKLVSELMIMANETGALYGRDQELPLVYRSQEPPERDPDEAAAHVPDGPGREYHKRSVLKRSVVTYQAAPHAGLGLEAYAQLTSPIRRATDLINQRQLLEHLASGNPRYTPKQLMDLLGDIEGGLEEAGKVQRGRNRYWLLKYLAQEKIKELDAVVVKVDGPKPLAELDRLHMIYPFHQKQKRQKSEPNFSHEVGNEIRLRVDSLDPRTDTLVLREV